MKFPTMPTEHIFKAGHQIGIIVGGSNTSMASGTGNDNVPVTLDTKQSKITHAHPGRLLRDRLRRPAPTPRPSLRS